MNDRSVIPGLGASPEPAIRPHPDLIRRLHEVVGDAGLVVDADAVDRHVIDWLGKWQGRAVAIVRPASTEQCAAVMKICAETRTPVVPQGGNTGMSGGATPDGSGAQLVLCLSRMQQVRQVDPINDTITVEAGVLLATVQAAAAAVDRDFPLSLGSEGSCTIGGNLATNAGGVAVVRYGNTRDLVLGIEAVLPDGRIWHGLKALRKDNSGYDLRHLLIGSEGTLGIITAAVLKLYPPMRGRASAWVGADSLDKLLDLLARMKTACGDRLVAFEMLSAEALGLVLAHIPETKSPLAGQPRFHALVELADSRQEGLDAMLESVLGDALADALIDDAIVATNRAQAKTFWKLREGISLAQVRAGKAIKHDIALPISSLPAFVAQAEAALAASGTTATLINFGHLGDGNLHFNLLVPPDITADAYRAETARLNRLVHDLVLTHEGSISAEHGIGQLRRDELQHYKAALDLELMRRIKQVLDPNQLMNPGKLL
jgi:FAD/FMN-containing dehydrogenase